jgi:hypothetical protein
MRNGASVVASEVHELSPPGAQLVALDSCGFDSRAGSFHFGEARLIKAKMDGLRIYVIADLSPLVKDSYAFYSRRNNGPFYCWTLYESSWSAARVNSSTFSAKELTMTSWKLVPADLQKSITEHYQD